MNQFTFIPDEKSFHEIRQKCLGASDFPILIGISNYCTPLELFYQKIGQSEPNTENMATKWGHRHELSILSSYVEEKTDEETATKFEIDYIKHKKIRKSNYKPTTNFFPFTEFHHPEFDFILAHPDMIDMANNINVEAKSGRRYASFRRDGFDGFDPDVSDESGIPLKYYIQCQIQMLCTGLDRTILRALIDTNTELSYEIKASKKIQEKLIDIGSRFMFCVKNNKTPMPINKNDVEKLFPKVQDKTSYLIGVDSEFANRMKDRKVFLSEKVKKYEDEITDINNSLMVLIGDNKYLYDENNTRICSQTSYEKDSLSLKDLLEKKPEIYNELKKCDIIKSNAIRFVR